MPPNSHIWEGSQRLTNSWAFDAKPATAEEIDAVLSRLAIKRQHSDTGARPALPNWSTDARDALVKDRASYGTSGFAYQAGRE
jgi:hypothetical protein